MSNKKVEWVHFEDEVFRKVELLLQGGALSVNPTRARAFRKKSYYSEPRKAEIEFEVSIEAFDEGATEPSLVWVWECKDDRKSKRKIQVSDVEILNSKIDQLGRSRFKASIVATEGFQSGALELAKSSGISLFTLQKELRRVLQYQNNGGGPREIKREVIAVLEGVTFDGTEIQKRIRFDQAFSIARCQAGF
jgi:hypothetical protein